METTGPVKALWTTGSQCSKPQDLDGLVSGGAYELQRTPGTLTQLGPVPPNEHPGGIFCAPFPHWGP